MREIKFRFYDEMNETMESVTKIRFEYGKVQEIWLRNGCSIDFMNGDGRFKLMQFTGLLDKNGKEIYEGDILRCVSETMFFNTEATKPFIREMEMRFLNGSFMLYQENINHYFNVYDDGKDLEVIGNIHEVKHEHLSD